MEKNEKTAKTAEKKPAAKKTAAKKAVKEEIYLQYGGREISRDDLIRQVKAVWTKELGNKIGDITSIQLYLKPEENMVYYVVNGSTTGSISL